MRRFTPYPIHISGSALDEDFRAFVAAISPFLTAEMKNRLIVRSNRLDYVNDDRPAAHSYEHQVQMVLAEINATRLGRTLLRGLPSFVPIWIIRYDSLAQPTGKGAITSQMSSDHTKGVRIQYSPEMWLPGGDGRQYPGYRPDETLLHEMVHASRFARFGYDAMNHQPLRDNDDHEEFLAVQLTNVYRSEKGAQKFNFSYRTSKTGSKAEVEYMLYSYEPYLRAIEDFLHDPMVKLVSNIATAFNPFRDLPRLKQARAQELQRARTDARPATRGGMAPPVRY